jgi:hypothetical protein
LRLTAAGVKKGAGGHPSSIRPESRNSNGFLPNNERLHVRRGKTSFPEKQDTRFAIDAVGGADASPSQGMFFHANLCKPQSTSFIDKPKRSASCPSFFAWRIAAWGAVA